MDAESADKLPKMKKISLEILSKLSEVLKGDWKKLAAKFGFNDTEVCQVYK